MKAIYKNNKTYYKYTSIPYEQPALSSDGVLGGSSFAVYATTNGGVPQHGRGTAYGATYPQTSSYNTYSKGGQPTLWMYLYTPNPTICTGCYFSATWGNYSDSYMYVAFEGSIDNSTWVTLYPSTTLHEGSQTLSFENSTQYKYYRLTVATTGGGYHDGMNLSSVRIIANELTITEGTSSDYSYYEGNDSIHLPIVNGKIRALS